VPLDRAQTDKTQATKPAPTRPSPGDGPAATNERIVSVDALRGFSIFWILGADVAMLAVGEIAKSVGPTVGAIGGFVATQFTHVSWEGFRFYDLIFPLFIFVVGVSIVLSLPRLVERKGKAAAHLRVLRRALILYGLGIIYYGGLAGSFHDIRWLGVLQRIALCYLFASLLFLHLKPRGLIGAFVLLVGGYWALMTFVPVPGIGAGSYVMGANLADWIDARYLPGRLLYETRDPEGILSTLPAIGTCLLGVFAGFLLKDERLTPQQKSLSLIGGGMLLVGLGYLWSLQFPIIKMIWTSSFVLVAGGYSAMLLGAMHQIVDVWQRKRWATILVWIGANAITLYVLDEIVGFAQLAQRFVGGSVANFLGETVAPGTGLFVTRALGLTFAIALAGFLYHRRIFLRV
jgi:predicted acyltransferase